MRNSPWQFLLLIVAGWVNRFQQAAIDYLKEENRVLREHLGERRMRFTAQPPIASRRRWDRTPAAHSGAMKFFQLISRRQLLNG